MKRTLAKTLSFVLKKTKLISLKPILQLSDFFYNKFPKQAYLIINNKKIFIYKNYDVVSKWLYMYNQWEVLETQLLKRLIKKGSTIIDVGAHIGYYTALASILAGKNGKVFAFEPEPENFTLLKKCKLANKLNNVTLINKAVSNTNKKIRLYLSSENKGDHRLTAFGEKNYISVKSITLDNYFSNYKKKIDLIKIDTQGAELPILEGMSKILSRNPNIIIILEFWPYVYIKGKNQTEELLQILKKNKFMIYEIDEGMKKIIPISPYRLLKKYSPKIKSEYTNLLCIRNTNSPPGNYPPSQTTVGQSLWRRTKTTTLCEAL